METVSRSGLLLWDRTALKSVRSGPVPVPQSGPASLPNKRYALWKRDTVQSWNTWWRQVLISSKTDGKFGYFVWTKAKRSTVWERFEQGADIQNSSPKALCKGCWKVFAHPELRTSGSSTSTLRCHAEHKKCGGSKTGQGLLSQFGAGNMVSK